MIHSRVLGVLLCASLLLLPAACDDPTDVGGGLINEPGVAPRRVVLPLEVDTIRRPPITGAAAASEINASRFLAGETSGDPLGDIEATGYVDFRRVLRPETPSDLTLDSVDVQFVPTYAYGDTLEEATFSLHDLTEEWEDADGARSDTSLAGIAEDAPITTFSTRPGDTVTVQLPDAWVSEHADEFEVDDDSVFAEEFHGFQVRPMDTERVVGFSSGAITLRAVFEEEPGAEGEPEALAAVARHLTTLRTEGLAPEDRYVIQEGTGRQIAFNFTFPDSLRNASVNNAALIFEADTALAGLPESFVRQDLEVLEVRDVPLDDDGTPDEDEDPVLPRGLTVTLDADSLRFESAFPLRALVQDALLGSSEIERLRLQPPPDVTRTPFGNAFIRVPALGSTLIRHDVGHRPRIVLTYTSTEEQ